VDIFMSYVFFGLSEIYVQTISKSIHGEIYWHGTMSMFCFSQKCFRTMLQHIMFPPKKNQPFHSDRRWTHDMPNPACSLQQTM
jgi:hypothetical protein